MDFKLARQNLFSSNKCLRKLPSIFKGVVGDAFSLATCYSFNRLLSDKNAPPLSLYFDLVNACNSNCIFCGYQFQLRKKQLLDYDLFNRVITEYKDLGGLNVNFTPLVGEPSLHPLLPSFLKRAKELDFRRIIMTTNAITIDRFDIINDILFNCTDIAISFSGFDEHEYRTVFRNKFYRKALSNIEKILQHNFISKKTKIKIHLRSSRSLNEILKDHDYIEHISPYINNCNELTYLLSFDSWGGMISDANLHGTMPLSYFNRIKFVPCLRLRTAMLMSNGCIRACSCRFLNCDYDELFIGDCNKSNLSNILNSQMLMNIYNKFYKKCPPKVCKNCSMYNVQFLF